jgi:murein peptide amidase A
MRPGPALIQRLGRNHGRYHGETIDIHHVRDASQHLALQHGWTCDTFLDSPEVSLRAYRRPYPGAKKNLYLSTGIHGDEPSGPLAVRRLLEENQWPEANLWLVPCLNPPGFDRNTRENADGIDLNRDYRHLTTKEVSAHVAWLKQQPNFDLTLLLHEDWEASGFYVYELNPLRLPSFAETIVDSVRDLCPIESAELVDNWPIAAGIIRPAIDPKDRPQWAEALYLSQNKTPRSYTLETPSDFPLALRVETHTRAVRRAFELFAQAEPIF